jgi:hypothetical protein
MAMARNTPPPRKPMPETTWAAMQGACRVARGARVRAAWGGVNRGMRGYLASAKTAAEPFRAARFRG